MKGLKSSYQHRKYCKHIMNTHSRAMSSSSSRLKKRGKKLAAVSMMDPISIALLAVVGSTNLAVEVDDGTALAAGSAAIGGGSTARLLCWLSSLHGSQACELDAKIDGC